MKFPLSSIAFVATLAWNRGFAAEETAAWPADLAEFRQELLNALSSQEAVTVIRDMFAFLAQPMDPEITAEVATLLRLNRRLVNAEARRRLAADNGARQQPAGRMDDLPPPPRDDLQSLFGGDYMAEDEDIDETARITGARAPRNKQQMEERRRERELEREQRRQMATEKREAARQASDDKRRRNVRKTASEVHGMPHQAADPEELTDLGKWATRKVGFILAIIPNLLNTKQSTATSADTSEMIVEEDYIPRRRLQRLTLDGLADARFRAGDLVRDVVYGKPGLIRSLTAPRRGPIETILGRSIF